MRKRKGTEGEDSSVQNGTIDDGGEGTNATGTVSSESGEEGDGNPDDSKSRKGTVQHRDRSNPPVYAAIGVNKSSGQMDVLCTFPTIGQMRKGIPNVLRMVGRFYSEINFARIRYLDLTKEE